MQVRICFIWNLFLHPIVDVACGKVPMRKHNITSGKDLLCLYMQCTECSNHHWTCWVYHGDIPCTVKRCFCKLTEHFNCLFQVAKWGRVEWSHDVEFADLKARVSAAGLFIHMVLESTQTIQKMTSWAFPLWCHHRNWHPVLFGNRRPFWWNSRREHYFEASTHITEK